MEAELPSQRKPDKIFILMEVEERQEEWGEREKRDGEIRAPLDFDFVSFQL